MVRSAPPTATTVLDSILFPRCVRHAAHAGGVLGPGADLPIRRGRGGLGEGRGAMRRHPAEDAAKEIAARSNVEALDFDFSGTKPTSSAIRSCRSCISS